MATLDHMSEPRQRWRIVFSRGAPAASSGADEQEAWRESLLGCGLPVLVRPGPNARPSFAIAASLPALVAGERELADVVLTERLPADAVRVGIERAMPPGHTLVAVHDVWVGESPLPGQVVAADYRVTLPQPGSDAASLRSAIATLLAASALPRLRAKGAATVPYDLRPLLENVTVIDEGPPACLRIRVRHHPERGRGRPEEVVAALGDACGAPDLIASSIVRERILLRGDEARAPEASRQR